MVLEIASVSYLNAAPLIYGLERDATVRVQAAVPSKLIDFLRDGRCDVALLPVIDYQRLPNLKIIPAGGIGSDGETLTVRLFARQPIETIRTLACDSDSHTSVALARIILAEHFDVHPELIDLKNVTARDDEAMLLIGDKVVCDGPRDFAFQYDLGDEWKKLTGLPFVFAVWTCRANVDVGDLPQRLEKAKREGLANIESIIKTHGIPRGWPADLARQYLTQNLQFDIGPREIEAIQKFHQLAARHRILSSVRPLDILR